MARTKQSTLPTKKQTTHKTSMPSSSYKTSSSSSSSSSTTATKTTNKTVTQTKPKVANVAKVTTNAKTLLPVSVQSKHVWNNCLDCKVNLSKWGLGNNVDGILCKPCARIRDAKDLKTRELQPNAIYLVVELNGRMWHHTSHHTSPLGTGPILSHSPNALERTAFDPLVTVRVEETGEENPTAAKIVSKLSFMFQPEAPSQCRGRVIFGGPGGHTLLLEEVKRLERFAQFSFRDNKASKLDQLDK